MAGKCAVATKQDTVKLSKVFLRDILVNNTNLREGVEALPYFFTNVYRGQTPVYVNFCLVIIVVETL